MKQINKERLYANIEGDFVVFMIGMRINKFFSLTKWLFVVNVMPRMLKELFKRPDSGFIHAEYWFGRTTIMVQYWRSIEQLEAYAKDKAAEHYPAWKEFNLKIRMSNAVGIWHESYKITSGTYENIYVNMPAFGLGKAGKLIPAIGKFEAAADRVKQVNAN